MCKLGMNNFKHNDDTTLEKLVHVGINTEIMNCMSCQIYPR